MIIDCRQDHLPSARTPLCCLNEHFLYYDTIESSHSELKAYEEERRKMRILRGLVFQPREVLCESFQAGFKASLELLVSLVLFVSSCYLLLNYLGLVSCHHFRAATTYQLLLSGIHLSHLIVQDFPNLDAYYCQRYQLNDLVLFLRVSSGVCSRLEALYSLLLGFRSCCF